MRIVTLALCASMISFTSMVSAGLTTYDVTISGNWFDDFGTPYGMPLSPALQGTLTVDSANAGNEAAFVDFSLATGSRTWSLNDYTGVPGSLLSASFDVGGSLTQFSLDNWRNGATGETEYFIVYSSNTAAVGDASSRNACNNCVSFTQSSSEPSSLISSIGNTKIGGDTGSNFDKDLPTVVVTHGLQLSGDYGDSLAIHSEMQGQIDKYYDGQFNVILASWEDAYASSLADAVNLPQAGAPNAGRALGLSILLTTGGDYSQPIHLIGHSFGTVVNAEIATILLRAGLDVAQFTALDAPLRAGVTPDRFVELSQNIPIFENYYGNDRLFPDQNLPPGAVGDPIRAGSIINVEVDGADHSGVWQEYAENRVQPLCGAFSKSLITGCTLTPSPSRPVQIRTLDDVGDFLPNIFKNSSFNEATSTLSIFTGSDGYSIFEGLEIPLFADTLAFDLLFTLPGDGDWLEVQFGNELLGIFEGLNFAEEINNLFFDVRPFRGTVGDLTLFLSSTGPDPARLEASNFRFLGSNPATVPGPSTGPLVALGILLVYLSRRRVA